jgi:hypothetical protein
MVSSEMAKRLLAKHGEIREQSPAEWTGTFALPPAVERFYRDVGPEDITIEAHGNPYFLPSLAGLWQLQVGYRWDGISGVRCEGWDDDWLVVAVEGSDPFIFVGSAGKVFHAFCGEGCWNPSEMFPNLETMAVCLAQIGAIVRESFDGYIDEDCCIRSEFKLIALAQTQELLGSASKAETVLSVLGWT